MKASLARTSIRQEPQLHSKIVMYIRNLPHLSRRRRVKRDPRRVLHTELPLVRVLQRVDAILEFLARTQMDPIVTARVTTVLRDRRKQPRIVIVEEATEEALPVAQDVLWLAVPVQVGSHRCQHEDCQSWHLFCSCFLCIYNSYSCWIFGWLT